MSTRIQPRNQKCSISCMARAGSELFATCTSFGLRLNYCLPARATHTIFCHASSKGNAGDYATETRKSLERFKWFKQYILKNIPCAKSIWRLAVARL